MELSPSDSPAVTDVSRHLADRDQVERALARLEPGHRAVVALHYLLGLSLSEVAVALGIPAGTAKSRLHYAVAEMRSNALADANAHAARIPGGQPA